MNEQFVADILKYGVTPVVVILLGIVGYIRFKPEVDGLLDDKKNLAKDNADLLNIYQHRILPLLETAVAAGVKSAEGVALLGSIAQDLAAVVVDLREVVREHRDLVRDLERFFVEERAKARARDGT